MRLIWTRGIQAHQLMRQNWLLSLDCPFSAFSLTEALQCKAYGQKKRGDLLASQTGVFCRFQFDLAFRVANHTLEFGEIVHKTLTADTRQKASR